MASPHIEISNKNATNTGVATVDMKLEAIVIPVSDVDRAKEFYRKLGWRQDVTPPGVFQFTPHGSPCSVQFGKNLTSAPPGSAQRTYLIVSDIASARERIGDLRYRLDVPRAHVGVRSSLSTRWRFKGKEYSARHSAMFTGRGTQNPLGALAGDAQCPHGETHSAAGQQELRQRRRVSPCGDAI